jgi:hypothetical protein
MFATKWYGCEQMCDYEKDGCWLFFKKKTHLKAQELIFLKRKTIDSIYLVFKCAT